LPANEILELYLPATLCMCWQINLVWGNCYSSHRIHTGTSEYPCHSRKQICTTQCTIKFIDCGISTGFTARPFYSLLEMMEYIISQIRGSENVPKLATKKIFFLGVNDPLKRYLHLKMLKCASKYLKNTSTGHENCHMKKADMC
jgi:hypothetical protein